jgi:hypothetical protein
MARRRFELSASGIDDGRIGLSTDPWTQGASQGPGLRVPPVLPSDESPATRQRYLFLLATRKILNPCRLIGMRQGLTIGCVLLADAPVAYPLECPVTTPSWCFVDGNVSWHLVYEDNVEPNPHGPAITDTNNWAKDCSDGPAMLYNTFTNTNVGLNGEPILYMENLTAYTPPQFQNQWKPVAGDLKCFYDIRFPYSSESAWDSFAGGDNEKGIALEMGRRVSLYASILQTNPNIRAACVPAIGAGVPNNQAPNGLPPEEAFLSLITNNVNSGEGGLGNAPVYWRVMGSLIFEDEIETGVRG